MKVYVILMVLAGLCSAQKVSEVNVEDRIITGDVLFVQTPYSLGNEPKCRSKLLVVPESGHVDLGEGIGITQVKGTKVAEIYHFLAGFFPIMDRGVEATPKKIYGLIVQRYKIRGLKAQNKVAFVGEMKKSQNLTFVKGDTLRKSIDKAGGVTAFATLNRVLILRDGQRFGYNIKISGKPVLLQPGDLVVVPQQRIRGR